MTMVMMNTKRLVEAEAQRHGISVSTGSVPDQLWKLWQQQGQCIGQMLSLVMDYRRCPESFDVR